MFNSARGDASTDDPLALDIRSALRGLADQAAANANAIGALAKDVRLMRDSQRRCEADLGRLVSHSQAAEPVVSVPSVSVRVTK